MKLTKIPTTMQKNATHAIVAYRGRKANHKGKTGSINCLISSKITHNGIVHLNSVFM